MDAGAAIALSVVFATLFLSVFILIRYVVKNAKAIKETQRFLSDKELIEFINEQPDKMVHWKDLVEKFSLKPFEAKARIRQLYTYGIVQVLRTRNGLNAYYTLIRPIDKEYDLNLTDDPFMTVEDLMLIFKHFDYQVSLQELCLVTGLPIKIILEEMKYFEKEKVVKGLLKTIIGGISSQRIYTLQEPYRSNPDGFLKLKDANFELKEIYEKVKKKA